MVEKSLSVKRFGPRYGRNVKERFGAIETLQRKTYTCPYCHAQATRRLVSGIWQCKKCDAKFTGRAYTIARKPVTAQTLMQLGEAAAAESIPEEETILSAGEEEEDVVIARQPDKVGAYDPDAKSSEPKEDDLLMREIQDQDESREE